MKLIKKIPTGNEDFKSLIEDSYYVDKTLLIKDILNMPVHSSLLIRRPRRFGKSLFLSTLKFFLEESEIDNKKYFINLDIGKTAVMEECSKNIVIYLNMKAVSGNTSEELMHSLEKVISMEFIRNYNRVKNRFENEYYKKEYESICDFTASDISFKESILFLSMIIFKATGKMPYILIDEYDAPVQKAYSLGFYDKIIEFFKSFYSSALKGNSYSKQAIITGVNRIGKESMFSGLNNLLTDSVLNDKFSRYFGFTESEVKDLLSYYGLGNKYDAAKKWYGGYKIGNIEIFNPWSILLFVLNRGEEALYWTNTTSTSIIGNLIENVNYDSIKKMNDIFQNNNTLVSINESVSYADFMENSSSLVSYLLFSGYFTIEQKIKYDSYIVKVPNKEIEEVYTNEIKNKFLDQNSLSIVYELIEAFLNGNANKFAYMLEKHVLSSFSYFDYSEEKNYQIMMLSILSMLFNDTMIKSECTSGKGRCDIMMIPIKSKEFGAIIEIKHLKSNQSKQKIIDCANAALKQIDENEYINELKRLEIKNIYKFGIAFYKNRAYTAIEKV